MAPEEEEQEDEEFEPAEEETVEEFESVEEEKKPEVVEEFDGFDENAPDDISSSGFTTKGGEIPGYEPTVDEVLSFAMGQTEDPSEPIPPKEKDAEQVVEEKEQEPELDNTELPPELEEALDEIMEDIVSADEDDEEKE
ncbi:MAG: hypothetical protein KAQ96_09895 [Thermoplasmata archaeon]|nr:hypothetical protein [Thermoplasmata archaeon]